MRAGAVSRGEPGTALILLAAVVLWASAFPIMKVLLSVMNPASMVWGRMIIATIILLPFVLRGWKRAERRRGDIFWLLALAAFEPCLYFVLESHALTLTSASQAGMIVSVMPLMVALGGFVFFSEAITRRMALGLVLSIAGVVGLTLAGEASAAAPHPWAGNFLEFLAMASAVGYVMLVKRMSPRYDIWFLTGFQMLVGAVFFTPGLFLSSGPGLEALLDPFHAALMVYLGIGVTVLAYACYNIGISRLPAARATAMLNLIPVFAVLISWLWLGERLNPVQLAFATLAMSGVWLAQKG